LWVIKRSSSASDDVCECVSYVLCCSSGSHHVCLWVCLRLRLPVKPSMPHACNERLEQADQLSHQLTTIPGHGSDVAAVRWTGPNVVLLVLCNSCYQLPTSTWQTCCDCVVTERKPNAMTENGKFLISVGSLDESVFQWFSATPVRCSRPTASRSGLQQGAR
jgi:hypothetical protein